MKWLKALKLKLIPYLGDPEMGHNLFLHYSYCYWSSSYASVLLRNVSFINQSYQSISHYNNCIIYLLEIVHDLCECFFF